MGDDVSRLRWLCRRGMKELDVVFTRYLEERYPHAQPSERDAFRELLDMQDPVIWSLLLGREPSDDPTIQNLIDQLAAQR